MYGTAPYAKMFPGNRPIGSFSSPFDAATLAEPADGSPPYASSFAPFPPSQ